MFIALDGKPRDVLKTIIQHHHLPIGLVVVIEGKVKDVWQPPAA